MIAGTALHRELFATPRASEFFELRPLQAQTGQPADKLDAVVVKELMDNALDAAESVDGQPDIALTIRDDGERVVITVTDNGPGMAPELIDQVLNFSVLVSDKAAYRSPTRGLQGNALKTIIGIPTALGSHDPVVIDSLGIRHTIRASIDPAGEVHIDHEQAEIEATPGTTITVRVPPRRPTRWDLIEGSFGLIREPVQLADEDWARSFALVNPHAQIRALHNCAEPAEPVSYKPSVGDAWHKPLPTDPTSPHWYDTGALERLVFAHINKIRRGGPDVPIGEFVRSFAGLSSTAKAKTVCAELSAVGHLSDFEAHRELVGVLLSAMQANSRAPKPSVLGQVPEHHYQACFAGWFGLVHRADGTPRFWFKRATITDGTVPWVMEVALAETERPGKLFYAVNYSPSFDDPLARLALAAGDLASTGAASFLRQLDAYPDGSNNRAAAIHLISPAVSFLDKGKCTLALR